VSMMLKALFSSSVSFFFAYLSLALFDAILSPYTHFSRRQTVRFLRESA